MHGIPPDVLVSRALDELSSFGINIFENKSEAEMNAPHMALGKPFRNFQWTTFGKLARCAQPGYEGSVDTAHSLMQAQMDFLRNRGIKRVISLNKCFMDKFSQQRLVDSGIAFTHMRIGDYEPLTQQNLLSINSHVEATAGATLVYCGYGQGRTGTGVAAWAVRRILQQRPQFFKHFDWVSLGYFLKLGFGVETAEQWIAIGEYISSYAAPNAAGQLRLTSAAWVRGLRTVPTTDVWTQYVNGQIFADQVVELKAQVAQHNPAYFTNGVQATEAMMEQKKQANIAAHTAYDNGGAVGLAAHLAPPAPPTLQPGIAPGNARAIAAQQNNGGTQGNWWDDMSDYEPDY